MNGIVHYNLISEFKHTFILKLFLKYFFKKIYLIKNNYKKKKKKKNCKKKI